MLGVFSLSAQTVNIPDTVLKSRLLNYTDPVISNPDPVIDTNGDGEIQVSEAEAITHLNLSCYTNNCQEIQDATGLEAFVNLNYLNLRGNALTQIDVSTMTGLDTLNLLGNNITAIDLTANTALTWLNLSHNPLDSIDVSQNTALEFFRVYQTSIEEFDVSNNPNLTLFSFYHDSVLTHVNLKNGNTANMSLGEGFLYTPNVELVCVDSVENFVQTFYAQQLADIGDVVLTSYCGYDPDSTNTITGVFKYDYGQGCQASSATGIPNAIIMTENNGNHFGTVTRDDGTYTLLTGTGTNTVFLETTYPNYFDVNPANLQTISFYGYNNVDTVNFCLQHTQSVADFNISLYAHYPISTIHSNHIFSIVVENMGTDSVSGQISFDYPGYFYPYPPDVYPTPSPAGHINIPFSNLQPLSQYAITINMQEPNPVPFDVGDSLHFSASVTPVNNDVTPNNNSTDLTMVVVDPSSPSQGSSYDPNDKQVMESHEIPIEEADEYLHYLIRFQNTGTANAHYVEVVDTLSQKLDLSTLHLSASSHDYRMEIDNQRILKFIFDYIDLPYEEADQEGSTGYIAYKIKPKFNVEVGDVIGSKAHIYFDDNLPIATNVPWVHIVDALSVPQQHLKAVKLYPNPTKGKVYLNIPNGLHLQQVAVYGLDGSLLFHRKSTSTIDMSHLDTGVYFVKLKFDNGRQLVRQVVKQ